jgi:hypothetical protein
LKEIRLLLLLLTLVAVVLSTILVRAKPIPYALAASTYHFNSSKPRVVTAHYRNGKSTQVQNGELNAISAVSANNIWAVGSYFDSTYNEYALIEHWNGSQWSVVPSPTSASGSDDLVDVKAISNNDVWAVGSSGIGSTTLIEHWNGSTWSIVTGAALPAGGTLHGLAVVSSNDVWAVGDEPNASYGNYALTEHWDGKQWSSIPAATNTFNYSSLNSVTALASNNVWAVGSTASPTSIANTQTNGDTLIEHWNGTTWNIIASPSKGFDVLTSVTAISAKYIWAVGDYGGAYNYSRLVEHWNGLTWSIVKSPTYPGLRENYIAGVASTSTINAWLVGAVLFIDDGYHFPQGFAEHWNGTKWSVVPVAHNGPNTKVEDNLAGVATITSKDAWAVGSQNYSSTLIEHWNGSQWQIVPSP